MESLKQQVGRRIKESRKIVGKTQKEVAQILMMTQQQYSRFETGIFELDYSQLVQVSRLFDVSVDYLLGLKDF